MKRHRSLWRRFFLIHLQILTGAATSTFQCLTLGYTETGTIPGVLLLNFGLYRNRDRSPLTALGRLLQGGHSKQQLVANRRGRSWSDLRNALGGLIYSFVSLLIKIIAINEFDSCLTRCSLTYRSTRSRVASYSDYRHTHYCRQQQ